MKERRRLWVVIFLGLILATFPLYGEAIGELVWGNPAESIISGKVVDKGEDYIKIEGYVIYLKGEWLYNGSIVTSEEILEKINLGDSITVHYWRNPKWGYIADEIVFEDGTKAIKEE